MITIVILIILATVSINAIFGNNGLIQSAEKGKIAQEKAEARERLEIVLADAYAEKHVVKEKYNENEYLDKFIYSREPDAEVAEAEISLNGYTFELDRSVPQLGEYIGEAGNLPPTIRNIKVIEKTETSAKIEVTVARGEGVKYKYSIKNSNEGDESYTPAVEKEENTYEFTGLEKSNKYTAKVELIKDNQVVDTEIIEIQMEAPEDSTAEPPAVAEGMTPVKWNGSNWVKTTANDKDWYNYSEKKWANVVLGDSTFNGEILDESKAYSMLVWIPRYAYQITSGYHQSGSEINSINATLGAGNINVVFVDKNNQDKNKTKTYSETYPSYTTGSGMSDYVVHPAFNYDGKKLAGIWIGKYETSHTGCTTDKTTGQDNTNVTTLTPMIKAGVTSWRYIGISNIFTVCTEMNKSGNSYGLNTNDSVIDPHMMKNSEWGAVAYLSKSKFGKETEEVWINNSSSYITGSAGNSASASENTGTTNDYKSSQGQKASTTGNVWGIYDMSGGAYEYVAAYINNGSSNLTSYGSTLVNAASKYKDVYKVTSDSPENNYNNAQPTQGQGAPTKDTGYYGDAVWETSNSSRYSNSWYGNDSFFPNSGTPFFRRGGYYYSLSHAGVFNFDYEAFNIASDYTRLRFPRGRARTLM